MHEIDRKNLKKYISHFNKTIRILDVGCGNGDNLVFLKKLGFFNLVGVDISQEMIDISKGKGFEIYSVDDISNKGGFDLILFSHILEHVGYPEIKDLLEYYFALANPNAHVIIIMPLMYDGFYFDVDHIKPYYANGLQWLFSEDRLSSRQYSSQYRLNLLDIRFRRQPLLPYHIKSRYIRTTLNKIIFRCLTIVTKIAKIISLGLLSKVTGYCALYKLTSIKNC